MWLFEGRIAELKSRGGGVWGRRGEEGEGGEKGGGGADLDSAYSN